MIIFISHSVFLNFLIVADAFVYDAAFFDIIFYFLLTPAALFVLTTLLAYGCCFFCSVAIATAED